MFGPRWALFIVLVIFAAMVVVVLGQDLPRCVVSTVWERSAEGAMTATFGSRMVGVVVGGEFVRMYPDIGGLASSKLTAMPMQAARAPEAEQLDLSAYEGQAIAVWGHDSGGWIYSAQVERTLDPVSAALVRWGL